MRAGDGADDVERVVDVGHPVAHRLVQRILERLRTRFDRHHVRAQDLHPIDVGGLALHVLGAHVHHALHSVACRDGRASHAVHPRAGLGDHPWLAHAPGEQRLADGVVHLVRAGVVEILALEIDLRAAEPLRPAPRVVDRARTADVVLELVAELGEKLGIRPVALVLAPELVQRVDERLRDEHAAVRTEVPPGVREVMHLHCELLR